MKNKQGFTLVELLVVIAIIGILSTVAIVNLNSARDKARQASAQAALSQITSAAILCHEDGQELAQDGSQAVIVTCTNAAPAAGTAQPDDDTPICDDAYTEAVWPVLPTGWYYDNTCSSRSSLDDWGFAACEGTAAGTCTVGGRRVTCDNTGCVTGFSTAA